MASKKQAMRGLWLRGRTWWLDVEVAGRGRVRISLETKDAVEALGKARRLRANPDLLGPKSSGLDAYLEQLRLRGVSAGWIDSGRYVIESAMAEMGVEAVEKITTPKLTTWFEKRLKQHSGTAVAYFKRIRRMLQWLVAERKLLVDPTAGIVLPKLPPNVRRQTLTAAEARRVIDECADPDLKFCLYCALHAGLRKGEIIAARPKWFDLDAGLLHIQNYAPFKHKGHQHPGWTIKDTDDRTVPLTSEFLEFLKGRGLTTPYMLRPDVSPGKALYRWDFKKRFLAHMAALELSHVTFHDLRRTFASLHASAGTSLLIIAKWLGDGFEVVEQRYAHLTPADVRINDPWTEKPPAKVNLSPAPHPNLPSPRRTTA